MRLKSTLILQKNGMLYWRLNDFGRKKYGDEYYIYTMALLEEQEAKEKEQQKEKEL